MLNKKTIQNALYRVAAFIAIAVMLLVILNLGGFYLTYVNVHEYISTYLGFSSYVTMFTSTILVLISYFAVPTVIACLMFGVYRKEALIWISGAMLFVVIALHIFGKDVNFDQKTGKAIKYYADTPYGRVVSYTKGFDPKTGQELKQMTPETIEPPKPQPQPSITIIKLEPPQPTSHALAQPALLNITGPSLSFEPPLEVMVYTSEKGQDGFYKGFHIQLQRLSLNDDSVVNITYSPKSYIIQKFNLTVDCTKNGGTVTWANKIQTDCSFGSQNILSRLLPKDRKNFDDFHDVLAVRIAISKEYHSEEALYNNIVIDLSSLKRVSSGGAQAQSSSNIKSITNVPAKPALATNKPRVEIDNDIVVWLDGETYAIAFNATTYNCSKVDLVAFFKNEDGSYISGTDRTYSSTDGFVATSTSIKSTLRSEYFQKVELSIPHKQLYRRSKASNKAYYQIYAFVGGTQTEIGQSQLRWFEVEQLE